MDSVRPGTAVRTLLLPLGTAVVVAGVVGGAAVLGAAAKTPSALAAGTSGQPELGRIDAPPALDGAFTQYDSGYRQNNPKLDVLARDVAAGQERVLVGFKNQAKRCLATYAVGEADLPSARCGVSRAVTAVELQRANSTASVFPEYISGQAPEGTDYLVVSGPDGREERVPVFQGGERWKSVAFLHAWPAAEPVLVRAFDKEGVETGQASAPAMGSASLS